MSSWTLTFGGGGQMFEVVRPVPGSTLAFLTSHQAPARKERHIFLLIHLETLWLVFPFKVWYANVALRLRGCVLNRSARTSLAFAPSLCYRQTTRTNKKIKMAEESKRARNKAAGASRFTQERLLHVRNNINDNWATT